MGMNACSAAMGFFRFFRDLTRSDVRQAYDQQMIHKVRNRNKLGKAAAGQMMCRWMEMIVQ